MAKLTEEAQTLIVTELACFRTPKEVAETVKEILNIDVDPRHVEIYNASRAGKKPAEKWCAIFAATRERFLKEKADLAISHRNWRLRELQDMMRVAKRKGNIPLASNLLEQAAKECGDVFTNRQKHEVVPSIEEMADALGIAPDDLRADIQRVAGLSSPSNAAGESV